MSTLKCAQYYLKINRFAIKLKRISKSTRYLSKDIGNENYFNSEWKLVVPQYLFYMKAQGIDLLMEL